MTSSLVSLTRSNPLRRRCASAYGVGEGLDQAMDTCRRLAEQGFACAIGYGATPGQDARAVADAHLAAFERLHAEGLDCHVSVKLSALQFDGALLAELDAAAAGSGRPLHIDALSPETVDATWRLVESAPRAARLGITLPGRWARSAGDTALARRLGLRVRIVKGQWAADGATGRVDPTATDGFLQVVDRLSGHTEVVGVATHDVDLLAASLDRLTASGTPCAAELFFGLPFSAQLRTARRYGVPVRVYVAYGDWGSPYGLTYLANRPAAAWWLLQDLLLGKDKTWRSIGRSQRRA
jgi:proline dehydrogenase